MHQRNVTDRPMRGYNRQTTMLHEHPSMQIPPTHSHGAFAPFPRSTWIHPHAPHDDFDRVCKVIWSRAKEAEERGRGPSAPETPLRDQARLRTEEQPTETDDLSVNTQYEEEDKQQHHTEFTLPCPYLSGRRYPRVAKPARVLSSVMEEEMKLNKEEAERKRNLDKEEWRVRNSLKKDWVAGSRSRTGKQQASNPRCPATEGPTDHRRSSKVSNVSRNKCEAVDEQNIRNSSDVEEDRVTLPELQSRDDDLDNNGCGAEENNISHLCDELSSDGEKDSRSSGAEKDFPALSTIRDGVLPHPTKPPASGKMHSQWEIPLSFLPHNIPTDNLASSLTSPVQAPVQCEAKTPQENSKTMAAAPTQQESYDLLADFPALQPPRRPLALGVLHNGNPKTVDAKRKGVPIHLPNHCKETVATDQRRLENVPHKVSPICAGEQKSALDLQTSVGQCSAKIMCREERMASNRPPPEVAGTDGAGANARSWACAAKAGMKQAAAPQEKARPCSFQQIVTITRAKAVTQNVINKVTPSFVTHHSYQGANPLMTSAIPNGFIRPGYPPNHQHFGAQAYRANCPPVFRHPRLAFQQARGNFPK